MKSKLVLLLLVSVLWIPVNLFAQKDKTISTLTILGMNKYTDIPIGYGVEIYFLEDKSKCDPDVGFRTLEEQLFQFEEYIKDFGFEIKDFIESKEKLLIEAPYKKLKYTSPDFAKILELMMLCRQNKFEVSKTYYLYPPHNYANEDSKAITALEDAVAKAEVISKIIKKKIVKILNIDDDTSTTSIFQSKDSFTDEQFEILLELLGSFGDKSRFESERKKPEHIGAYSLRVTFQIED